MSALRDALRDLPDTVFADLLESDEAYLLVIDLPGVTAETMDVSATDGKLTIEARRRKETPSSFRYLQEERSMFLDAEIPLPPDVTGSEASATVDRGVLEIRLPKRTATAERTIPVEDA